MKTLAHERDRAEIARRLTTIRPDARALWGKMSAHQMVCHLTTPFASRSVKRQRKRWAESCSERS